MKISRWNFSLRRKDEICLVFGGIWQSLRRSKALLSFAVCCTTIWGKTKSEIKQNQIKTKAKLTQNLSKTEVKLQQMLGWPSFQYKVLIKLQGKLFRSQRKCCKMRKFLFYWSSVLGLQRRDRFLVNNLFGRVLLFLLSCYENGPTLFSKLCTNINWRSFRYFTFNHKH